jgi:rRNA maturation endonuclease Nob1
MTAPSSYFIAHAESVEELKDKDQLNTLLQKRLQHAWVKVTLPDGEVHEYFVAEGEDVEARLHATGALVVGGRVYGPNGWAFMDGEIALGAQHRRGDQ